MPSPTFGEGWLKHPSPKRQRALSCRPLGWGTPHLAGWLWSLMALHILSKKQEKKKKILASNLNLPGLSCQH